MHDSILVGALSKGKHYRGDLRICCIASLRQPMHLEPSLTALGLFSTDQDDSCELGKMPFGIVH